MKKTIFPLLLVLLISGCGSGKQLRTESTTFQEFRDFSPGPLLPGTISITRLALLNQDGKVSWNCSLENITDSPLTVLIHIRFFDRSFTTEYEKFGVHHSVQLNPGQIKRLQGRIDFSGLPEGGNIQRLGIGAELRNARR